MPKPAQKPNYTGKFSEIYDLFYAHKTYTQEADFVQAQLLNFSKKTAHKILELGCGTGTHSFHLEKKGHQIVAIDLSPDMINKAKIKAASIGSRVSFFAQDMSLLDQPARPFDAVICLFDSSCYITEKADFESLLARIHAHLTPSGLFIFEFWNAPAMIKHLDPIRLSRLQNGAETYLKLSEAELDYQRQLYKVNYTLYEVRANGTCQTYTEQHINRYYQIQEIAYFLSKTGFTPLKWFAGYSEDEIITGDTWNILCVAHS